MLIPCSCLVFPQGLQPAVCRVCLFAKGAAPGRRPGGERCPRGDPAARPHGLDGLDALEPAPQPLTPGGGEVWLLSGAAPDPWTDGQPAAAAMPLGGLLPLFGSPAGGGLGGGLGGGGGRKGSGPAAFRLTEKFVLLLVFSAFITLCFGAIFFLPDSSKLLSGVLFHSSPALQPAADHKPGPGVRAEDAAEGRARHREEGAPEDPAVDLEDHLARIRENHERALREAKETLQKLPEEIQRDILREKEKVAQDQLRDRAPFRRLPPVDFTQPIGVENREPADALVREKRAKIKEVSAPGQKRVPEAPSSGKMGPPLQLQIACVSAGGTQRFSLPIRSQVRSFFYAPFSVSHQTRPVLKSEVKPPCFELACSEEHQPDQVDTRQVMTGCRAELNNPFHSALPLPPPSSWDMALIETQSLNHA